MASDVKHTLLNLEIAPPEGAWEHIAARLGEEFDAGEIKVSQKLSDIEITPPAGVWMNVSAALDTAQPVQAAASKGAVVRILRKWVAVAAVLLVVATGAFYLLNNNNTGQDQITATEQLPVPAIPEHTPPAMDRTQLPEVEEAEEEIVAARRFRSRNAVANPYQNMVIARAAYVMPQRQEIIWETDLRPAEPDDIPAMDIISDPNVQAPPIRDDNGNIILDPHLILGDDGQYIVVTSPNGQQTRISSKFLPLLTSLHGRPEPVDHVPYIFNEDNMWKQRIHEWKDKMLKQASFIPAATNFLDLLELKEILLEN